MPRPRDIESRVRALAVATVRWARAKPAAGIDRDIVRQLVRATTSIGANLEEARAAETKPDFVHKVSVARKESLEAEYWAQLMLTDLKDEALSSLTGELHQVSAILTSIARKAARPHGGDSTHRCLVAAGSGEGRQGPRLPVR